MVWTLQSYAMMETGEMGWSLTPVTAHGAGSILNITFEITNPTVAERQYKVYIGLFDLSGPVITTFPLTDTFAVAAGSTQLFTVSIRIDYSNCILQGSLYDIETGRMGASLQTILELPPGVGEQIAPIVSFAGRVMVLSMVASIFTEVGVPLEGMA